MSGTGALKYLQGSRVYLRRLARTDADYYLRAVSDPNLRRLSGTTSFFTRKMIENAFDKWQGDSSRIDLIICLQGTHQVIGGLAILDIEHLAGKGSFHIAITDEEYTSKGYGNEALHLVINYMFSILNLRRIAINVYSFNARAIKAYEKLGFKQEGVLREDLYLDGEYHDNILMGLLKSEYIPANR